jgi:NitT/TauT family transport system substrate-binding protein
VVDDSIAREVFKEAGYKPVDDKATLGYIYGAKAADSPFKD